MCLILTSSWHNQSRKKAEGEGYWLTRWYWPLTRNVKLRVTHAPGMPGTFSPPPRVSYPNMHHGTCVKHVPWCMPGSLTNGFIWSRRSRRMRNAQCYISGKRPMAVIIFQIFLPYVLGSTVPGTTIYRSATQSLESTKIYPYKNTLWARCMPTGANVTNDICQFFKVILNSSLFFSNIFN